MVELLAIITDLCDSLEASITWDDHDELRKADEALIEKARARVNLGAAHGN